MAYILFRKRPNAKQQFNNFKIATSIAEKSGGSRKKAEELLAKMYYKSVSVAAAEQKVVPVLPPDGNDLWSWNRSFDIACDVASQYETAEIPLLVPEQANIFIGKEIIDMDEGEKKDALDLLDFAFGEKEAESDDAISSLIDKEANKPKWLGDFGGDLERMMQREQLEALTDIESPELKDEALSWEKEADDIKNIVENAPQDTFSKFLTEKMAERDMKPARLARKSNMLSTTMVRLMKGVIPIPSKSQILAIGIALELPREEFEHMLSLAGYILSPNVPRDAIVSYYLDNSIYNLEQINRALFLSEIPTLGTHLAVPR